MEKKAFSYSRLRVILFLMFSATIPITSFWMILDVFCAFFLLVSRCSRNASSRLAIISRIAQWFSLLDDVLVQSSVSPRSGKFQELPRSYPCWTMYLSNHPCRLEVASFKNCPEVTLVGRCTYPIIRVASKWPVLFSTKYNCFYNPLQEVNVFLYTFWLDWLIK